MENRDVLSVALADQMLTLVRASGATHLEAAAALNSVLQLLPTLGLSLVRPDEKRRPPRAPP